MPEPLSPAVEAKLLTLAESRGDTLSILCAAYRLALATVEARHAQREAWWLELEVSTGARRRELRKRLGLEG